MVTFRLDTKTEQAIGKMAKKLGLTKSELIRASIKDYLARQNKPSAWESGKDLFGKYSSGRGDLSSTRKERPSL
ncbi:CopG family transcriptional regulator [Myxococcota bacterium]|nr:CopG family transcriptional regulator [Myxococcota bacterium]